MARQKRKWQIKTKETDETDDLEAEALRLLLKTGLTQTVQPTPQKSEAPQKHKAPQPKQPQQQHTQPRPQPQPQPQQRQVQAEAAADGGSGGATMSRRQRKAAAKVAAVAAAAATKGNKRRPAGCRDPRVQRQLQRVCQTHGRELVRALKKVKGFEVAKMVRFVHIHGRSNSWH
jgi:hypothetical protein